MTKELSADADAYDKEYDAFIKQLEDFHQQRGTAFKKLPRINGKCIDLYLLYVVVTARGGWQKVNSKGEWDDILEDFRLPTSCTNSSIALKHIYIRYLDAYERIHFLGEDGDERTNDGDDDDSRPARSRRHVRTLNVVPSTYNYAQHNITEIIRATSGMSTEMYKSSSYDRLALSLSCPLPNEHDFAFNMCTLLSNEGKHTLQLSQCLRLIEFMLAHTGVFRDKETQKYFISNYKDAKGKNLIQFWIDSVDDKSVLDLLSPECYDIPVNNINKVLKNSPKLGLRSPSSDSDYSNASLKETLEESSSVNAVENSEYADSRNEDQRGQVEDTEESTFLKLSSNKKEVISSKLEQVLACEGVDLRLEPEDAEIFHLGRDLGLLDSEGTRISQVLHILRNLSFEEVNVSALAQSSTCLRFLVLCVCSRWGGLAVGALDTLGNIAAEIILRDPAVDPASALLLTTISQGVSSQDRAFVLRSLEVLNKLSINDLNEEILSCNIEQGVYDQICRYLTIHDIMLLIYTLESLYSLSSLGMSSCNAIVRSKGSVQTLISLLTVEAQSYGPEACIGMKVVETVTGVVSETENSKVASNVPATTVPITVNSTNPAMVTVSTLGVTTPVTVAPAVTVQTSTHILQNNTNTVKVISKPSIDPKRITPRIVPQEVEDFVIEWVTSNYEACSHNTIEQAFVYRHFTASMDSLGRKQRLSPVLFSNYVRKVFGTGVGPSRRPVDDGTEKWHYNGIKRRDGIVMPAVSDKTIGTHSSNCNPNLIPTPIIPAANITKIIASTTANSVVTPTKLEQPVTPTIQGSILKAHLSAPLRNSPSPVRSLQTHQVMPGGYNLPCNPQVPFSNVQSSISTSIPSATTGQSHQPPIPRSDNSTLIKSLLASKVTTTQSSSSAVPLPPHFVERRTPLQHHHHHHQQQSHQGKILPSIIQGNFETANTSSLALSSNNSGTLPPISTMHALNRGSPLGSKSHLTTHGLVRGAGIGSPSSYGNTSNSAATLGGKGTFSVTGDKTRSGLSSALSPQIHQVAPVSNLVTSQTQQVVATTSIPLSQEHHRVGGASISQIRHSSGVTISQVPHPAPAPISQVPAAATQIRTSAPLLAQSSDQVLRNIQKQNGPTDVQENSTDAKSAVFNGVKEESHVDGKIITSFEGILQNGLKEEKKENLLGAGDNQPNEKRNLLADLLERTVGGDVLNGVVEKDLKVSDKVIQFVNNQNKVNGPISSANGQIETPHGIKRPATPDASAVSSKRIAVEDPTSSSNVITLYAGEKGNDVEVLSQGRQVILNQGQQIHRQIVPASAQVVNMTPQGQIILPRPVSQDNVIIQQSPQVMSQGSNSQIISQRVTHPQVISQTASSQVLASGSSNPVLTQTSTGHTQVINSQGTQVIAPNSGQVFHQVITSPLPGGQLIGRQVLIPQGSGQSIGVQSSGNLSGQVIVQGVTPGSQNSVIVQGTGHGQVLVPQVLLPGNNIQGQLVMTSQGQAVVSSTNQQNVVVLNSSGQAILAPGNQGQQVVVSGSGQNQGQMVIQGGTVFQTGGQKSYIILPNSKVVVNHSSGQLSGPRQVVQVVTSSNSSIITSPIRTVRSVTNVADSNTNVCSNSPTLNVYSSATPTPSGPNATPVIQTSSATSTASHIPAPQLLTSGVIRRPAKAGLQFICEWKGCNLVFSSPSQVYHHACKIHCPPHIVELTCQWAGCDSMVRKRFSAMTHIQDRHCNEQLLQVLALRRQQISLTGKTDIPVPQTPPPHPGYAPNAAFHAIKRHALEVINQRDAVEKEGPVTKSIRLTAALILRNLVIYSNMGKKLLRGYESDLANVAISSMESSRTVSQILYDIQLPDHQAL